MSEEVRIIDVLGKIESSVERLVTRVEALETRAAASGLIRPTGMVAAIGLFLSALGMSAGLTAQWVETQTGKRAAEEKVAYLASRIDSLVSTERRMTQVETTLAIAMRAPIK